MVGPSARILCSFLIHQSSKGYEYKDIIVTPIPIKFVFGLVYLIFFFKCKAYFNLLSVQVNLTYKVSCH